MEDARAYLAGVAPAVEGLFKMLNEFGWQKISALVSLTQSQTLNQLRSRKQEFSQNDIAREVIAGSILQIAYAGLARHSEHRYKSENVIAFEASINKVVQNNSTRYSSNRVFELPVAFCVGREIGQLPQGILIYAGRNQYNHFYERKRLSVVNELVFNYLQAMWPKIPNMSFDLRPGKCFSYPMLCALGWMSGGAVQGFTVYERDMAEMLKLTAPAADST